ncbi:MAG TPA: hypothetical protein VLL95_08095, partial [Phnomibacter sp.]|nr:hypothetical protein [Phnomibacter sp.]
MPACWQAGVTHFIPIILLSISRTIAFTWLVCSILLFVAKEGGAQMPKNMRMDSQGRMMGPNQMKGGDSLKQRNNSEDSITIFYRMFDSSRIRFIDSSVGEFTNRFPLPNDHLYLGALGAA